MCTHLSFENQRFVEEVDVEVVVEPVGGPGSPGPVVAAVFTGGSSKAVGAQECDDLGKCNKVSAVRKDTVAPRDKESSMWKLDLAKCGQATEQRGREGGDFIFLCGLDDVGHGTGTSTVRHFDQL